MKIYQKYQHFTNSTQTRGQGESDGPYRGHVTEGRHWWTKEGPSYSPGVTDPDYSLSPPKIACAWRATSYERWPCCTEHSGSKGV